MDKKTLPERPDEWLKDIPVQSEAAGFDPAEMLVCPQCGRRSPPTRAQCFYCAADLPVSEAQKRHLKLNLRRLEDWEKGFNVIYLPKNESENPADTSVLARLIGLETEDFGVVFKSGKTLPLVRLESEREAKVLSEKLAENGIDSAIVSDESLRLETPNLRLRAIDFAENRVVVRLFNTGETIETAAENLSSIVVGAIVERKMESTESIKRKKEGVIKESAETFLDQPVIDVYAVGETFGWRIEANGFDFSGLGAEKSLLAAENMRRLAEKLHQFAPGAAFDDDYKNVRAALSRVWEVAQRRDSGGVQRSGLGSFNRRNVTVINNSAQFNRYSRLRRNLV